MNQFFALVTLTLPTLSEELFEEIKELAYTYNCDGIEEYNYSEELLDKQLGQTWCLEEAFAQTRVLDIEQHLEEKRETAQLKFYFYQGDYQENAQNFKQIIEGKVAQVKVVFELIEDKQDWINAWKESYVPIVIDNHLTVLPAWEKQNDRAKTPYFLYINPGMGFGTGQHETTSLCLQFLVALQKKDKNYQSTSRPSCLDFGCGSGILGIAAALMGFRHIDFVDIDEAALENCRYNWQLNFEVSNQLNNSFSYFHLSSQNLLKKQNQHNELIKYDLIFANILLNTLLEQRDFLIALMHEKSYLILSGLLSSQVLEVENFYSHSSPLSLKLREKKMQGDWCALLFTLA